MSPTSRRKKHPDPATFSDPHDILMDAPIGIFSSTPDGRYISANPALASMYGYDSPEELIESVTDIAKQLYVDPADRETFIRLMKDQGRVDNYECRLCRKDGSIIWVSRNARALKDEKGRVVACQGFNTNITERKQAEGQWQITIDAMPDLVAMIDTNHRIQRVNRSMAQRLNCSPEEICGRYCYEIVHGTTSPPEFCPHSKSMCNRSVERVQIFEKLLGGFFDVTTTPIYNSAGKLEGSLHIARDISEGKQAQEEIRKFKTLSDQAVHGIAISDMQGNLLYVNDYFARIHGYRPDELTGLDLSVFHSEQQLADVQRIIQSLITDGQYINREVWHTHKNGNTFPMLMSGVVIRDEHGNARFLAATAIDITEQKRVEETLRESEEQKSYILELIPDIIIKTNSQGKCLDIISSSEAKLYRPKNELLGKNIPDILPEKQASLFMEAIHKAIQNQSLQYVEYELKISSDNHWYEGRIIPARDNEVLAMIRDITDSKKAQDDLRRLTSEYETILNHLQSADFFLNVDERGVFTFERLNACHERLTGLKTQEIRGKTPVQVLGEKLGAEVENNYQQCLERKETIRYEEVLDLPGGRKTWLTSLTPVIIDGRVEKIVGNSLDITELKSQERKLALILRAAKNVSFVVARYNKENHDVLIEEFSPGAENIFGYSKEEVLGRQVSMLHADQDAAYFQDIYEIIIKGETWHGKSKLLRKNGETFPALLAVQPFEDEQGNCALGVSIDISELEKIQQELFQAKEQAEAANQAKSEFLANMSHEIRTPINGIMGMMQLLQMSELDDEQKEYVDLSIASAKRLTRLLADILDLSMVEAGKMIIHNTEFAIQEIADSVSGLFTFNARTKKVDLDCRIDPAIPPMLVGDEARVRQILFNLVGNALKFTEKGHVGVEMTPLTTGKNDALSILFTVTDTGIGIPEDKVDSLFDRFYQVEGSYTRSFQGAGLGLPIVKRLVDLMGGTIDIASQVGKGTSIYVVLPFKLPDSEKIPAEEGSGQPSRTKQGLRVLLAEDEPSNAIVVLKMLEKAGHQATLAENGQQVLDLIAVREFDLILMDVQMPVMNGIDATKRIRSRESGAWSKSSGPQVSGLPHETARTVPSQRDFSPKPSKRIPIIALTAYAMAGDREKFLEAGMDDYISKPVRMQDLEKLLSRYSK
jgi:PAS domain S-box-containing protein